MVFLIHHSDHTKRHKSKNTTIEYLKILAEIGAGGAGGFGAGGDGGDGDGEWLRPPWLV